MRERPKGRGQESDREGPNEGTVHLAVLDKLVKLPHTRGRELRGGVCPPVAARLQRPPGLGFCPGPGPGLCICACPLGRASAGGGSACGRVSGGVCLRCLVVAKA